jgi:ureidoglycolate hydrolase
MTTTIEIPLEPLNHEAFAPYGMIVGELPKTPDWARPGLDAWKMRFDAEGRTELRIMRYHRQPPEFFAMERHVTVTESRMPLGGARAIMVVAPVTDNCDPEAYPAPGTARAFLLDGTQGLMLWRGTWHALDCFTLGRDSSDFAFISEVETEDEIEMSTEAVSRERTQIVNYLEVMDTRFKVVDPKGLALPDRL